MVQPESEVAFNVIMQEALLSSCEILKCKVLLKTVQPVNISQGESNAQLSF